MIRGTVVVVEFPYVGGSRGKNRPALIIQNDRDNRRLGGTVVHTRPGYRRVVW